MAAACEHTVGYLRNEQVSARHWNKQLAELLASADQSGELDPALETNRPDVIRECRVCPNCASMLDRIALGLLTYTEAFVIYTAHKYGRAAATAKSSRK